MCGVVYVAIKYVVIIYFNMKIVCKACIFDSKLRKYYWHEVASLLYGYLFSRNELLDICKARLASRANLPNLHDESRAWCCDSCVVVHDLPLYIISI